LGPKRPQTALVHFHHIVLSQLSTTNQLEIYHMKKLLLLALSALLLSSCGQKAPRNAEEIPSLKDVFPNYKVGVAINVTQSCNKDSLSNPIIIQHFNSIVAENCMKCEAIHPKEDTYFWDDADQFVKFGSDNGMQIIGHCLIWHSQCAPWFGIDRKEQPVSAEVLKERMQKHITTIVRRYRGRIDGWDVVNEMIMDDGSYRNSFFYQILGEEYIPLAFEYAHEADPNAELYLNDYNMSAPGKRDAYVELIKKLKARGCRLDAIGLQCHIGMDYPDWEEFEKSIQAFIEAGVDVQFTEVDMGALPTVTQSAEVSLNGEYDPALNPYPEALPDSVSKVWNERMTHFLSIVDKYKDHVRRVTAWGVTDRDSWKNDWPIKGRTDYPLWFDRQGEMKPFLKARMEKLN